MTVLLISDGTIKFHPIRISPSDSDEVDAILTVYEEHAQDVREHHIQRKKWEAASAQPITPADYRAMEVRRSLPYWIRKRYEPEAANYPPMRVDGYTLDLISIFKTAWTL